MTNYPDQANQAYIVRDHAEEELEESTPWWLQLTILVTLAFGFLTIVFLHDFL